MNAFWVSGWWLYPSLFLAVQFAISINHWQQICFRSPPVVGLSDARWMSPTGGLSARLANTFKSDDPRRHTERRVAECSLYLRRAPATRVGRSDLCNTNAFTSHSLSDVHTQTKHSAISVIKCFRMGIRQEDNDTRRASPAEVKQPIIVESLWSLASYKPLILIRILLVEHLY